MRCLRSYHAHRINGGALDHINFPDNLSPAIYGTNNNNNSNTNNNNTDGSIRADNDRKRKGTQACWHAEHRTQFTDVCVLRCCVPIAESHNPYNGVVCNDTILATGVFASTELWKLSKGLLVGVEGGRAALNAIQIDLPIFHPCSFDFGRNV